MHYKSALFSRCDFHKNPGVYNFTVLIKVWTNSASSHFSSIGQETNIYYRFYLVTVTT